MQNEAQAGSDVIFEPCVNLLRIEIFAVGMAQREIMRTNLAVGAVSDADATDVAVTPWPARPAVRDQPAVHGLAIERNQADPAEIGQLGRRPPVGLCEQHRI